MTKFAVWASQHGEGCDYTIGCGNMLVNLKSDNLPDAIEEAKTLLIENYGMTLGSEREAEKIVIVEIKHEIDPDDLLPPDEEDEEDAATMKRRAQYEKLKREFG